MSKIQELKKTISEAQQEITQIQNECSHPKSCVTKEYKSNTGNYDPSCDVYWVNLHCSLCDKHWTEKQ